MSTTWRKEPFERGRSYRVRKAFSSLREEFREGEILRFRESFYSHYDSLTSFYFIDEEEKGRSWDVGDEQPLESWSDLFEQIK